MKFGFHLTAIISFVACLNNRAADSLSGTNTPAKSAEPTFEVRSFQVVGNTVLPPRDFASRGDPALPPKEFDVLTNYTGKITFERLREAVGALQMVYRRLGFATVSVTLPQQKLTNGIVTLKVVEGRLVDITITGSHYYSSNNVRRALPSLTTNILINTYKWFQPELDQANANVDRQIYPVVSPGPDPGTTALLLKVKDRLPLHAHIEVNDKSTPDTPLLRVDGAVQYNNLWQLNHQLGVEYNFSPQEMKQDDYSPNFLNQPMVASYSGFYRIPFGVGEGLRETYERLPVDFGYDQITHRFNLPPATGGPELTIYASRSVSDTPVRYGPVTLITNTSLADISSQPAQRDLTFTENLGTKLTIPIREFAGVRSSLQVGVDYKSYEARNFQTNLTYFDLYSLDQYGNRILVTNETIALGVAPRVEVHYVPISIGWAGARPDPSGATSFQLNESFFVKGLGSGVKNFQAIAGASRAGGDFTTINATIVRDQNLVNEWSARFLVGGQWSSAPLINNEQFELGGSGGVRGYEEGGAYGDSGWRSMFDLRAPPVNIGYLPDPKGDIPADLRCSWFMDYGQLYDYKRISGSWPAYSEWGTGIGFFFTAGEHVDARLTLAWALLDAPNTRAGSARAYFAIGVQF